MLFNIVDASNYKESFGLALENALSRFQRTPSERYGSCIGRINALLAISKQTLILAFCLFYL